jgi:outer membrane protein assembly factor BamB
MRHLLPLLLLPALAPAADWPQWMGPDRDGVWKEAGIVEKFPKGGPKQLWTAKVGEGYAGPAVVGNRVFVMDVTGKGDEQKERVICVSAKDGSQLWTHEYACKYDKVGYPAGPRCTPLVDGEFVYTVGTMGHLFCLKTKDGSVVWRKDYRKDYKAKLPIWGFASHPVIENGLLIAVTGGTTDDLVVAFDPKTGEEKWKAEATAADCGYAAVTVHDFGKTRTAVVWHGGAVVGLDPATGKRLWKQDFKANYGLTAPTPMKVGDDRLFVTAFYEGPMMLKVTDGKEVSVEWKGTGKSEKPEGTDKLHSIMPTPIISGKHIYGVCSYGELRCLTADKGERLWETRIPTVGKPGEEGKATRWGNAFLTPHEDRVFLFNEQGELVIAKLTPKGYEEIDRAKIVTPTNKLAGRPVVWVHPAFADKKVFVRNDAELVCVDLAK